MKTNKHPDIVINEDLIQELAENSLDRELSAEEFDHVYNAIFDKVGILIHDKIEEVVNEKSEEKNS